MSRTIEGIGFIKEGIYKTLDVAGVGMALGNIDVKKIHVKGIFKGKEVQNTEEMIVEGVASGKLNVCHCADILRICGKAKIQRTEENSVVFKGEGTLRADTIVIDGFYLKGVCQMNKLEAPEVHIIEINNNRYVKNHRSVVDEIVCRKMIAYDLKAKNVTAQEVELHGNCEIDTLICGTIAYCDSGCVIKNHIKKN